jgi:hypothetical protein
MPQITATTEPVRVPAPVVMAACVRNLRPEHVEVHQLDGRLVLALGPVDVLVDTPADVIAFAWRMIASADALAGLNSTWASDDEIDGALDDALEALANIVAPVDEGR